MSQEQIKHLNSLVTKFKNDITALERKTDTAIKKLGDSGTEGKNASMEIAEDKKRLIKFAKADNQKMVDKVTDKMVKRWQ